jgi:hypothetical protein
MVDSPLPPERVRQLAAASFPEGLPVVYSVDGQTVAVLVAERAALARQVIALREFAEDAVTKMEQIADGGAWPPNPRVEARVLRARLDLYNNPTETA